MGLGLSLNLQDHFDMEVLTPVLRETRWLGISAAPGVRGWRVLSQSTVARLISGEPTEMLPTMPYLQHLVGLGANTVGGLSSPRLIEASVDLLGQRWPSQVKVSGPVEKLQLMNVRSFPGLEVVRHPDRLRELRIHRLDSIDLSPLREAKSLEWLDLSKVRRVHGLDVVSDLPKLERFDRD